MNRFRTLLFALAAVGLWLSAADAAPLEGRWRLVRQTYGQGDSNLVGVDDDPLQLEFTREGAGIVGRLSRGDGRGASHDWPALITGDQVRAVQLQERLVPGALDSIRVRYRVDPAPGDDLTLEIVEEYRVVEDGASLVGTVTVSFRRHGKPKGSYTLHRRFERAP